MKKFLHLLVFFFLFTVPSSATVLDFQPRATTYSSDAFGYLIHNTSSKRYLTIKTHDTCNGINVIPVGASQLHSEYINSHGGFNYISSPTYPGTSGQISGMSITPTTADGGLCQYDMQTFDLGEDIEYFFIAQNQQYADYDPDVSSSVFGEDVFNDDLISHLASWVHSDLVSFYYTAVAGKHYPMTQYAITEDNGGTFTIKEWANASAGSLYSCSDPTFYQNYNVAYGGALPQLTIYFGGGNCKAMLANFQPAVLLSDTLGEVTSASFTYDPSSGDYWGTVGDWFATGGLATTTFEYSSTSATTSFAFGIPDLSTCNITDIFSLSWGFDLTWGSFSIPTCTFNIAKYIIFGNTGFDTTAIHNLASTTSNSIVFSVFKLAGGLLYYIDPATGNFRNFVATSTLNWTLPIGSSTYQLDAVSASNTVPFVLPDAMDKALAMGEWLVFGVSFSILLITTLL